ncbi:MAG: transpeptidase family protein, partial [Bacteroidales bacterium]|nr:transpeptidase family protein [Bacteroidales bacterium]
HMILDDNPQWSVIILLVFNALFIAAAFGVVGRIIQLKYFWEPVAETYQYFGMTPEARTVSPSRGNIYSHDGKLLAGSSNLYQIKMDCTIQYDYWREKYKEKPQKLQQTEDEWRALCRQLCDSLSVIFPGMSGQQYYDKIISLRTGNKPGRKNWKIGPMVDYQTYQRVKALPLFSRKPYYSGLIMEMYQTREYPYGTLARKTIGKVSNNEELNNDKTGIEGKFNHILHGANGIVYMRKTDSGNTIPDPKKKGKDPRQGADVRTTLDMEFQAIADKALRESLEKNACLKGGCAVIMDVKTGAIRAMANLTKQDNGHIGETYNWAVLQSNNPGSVMKTITLTAAIDDGFVHLNTQIPTFNGQWTYHKTLLKDAHVSHAYYPSGYISVGEGLKISANHVFQYIAGHYYENDPKDFIAKLHEYKMLEQFDFDINGLPRPICNGPGSKYWNWSNLPQMGTGYSINVTPLHLLTFYNAIANGGRMMKPYLVESIEKDGKVIEERGPEILNGAICSPQTAAEVTKGLLAVTQEEKGTAYFRMKDCKLKVAGKTGTAFYVIPASKGGNPHNPFEDLQGNRERQCTFAGFFPAQDPQYTAIIALYTYRTKEHIQGTEGATVLKEIINALYPICPQWQEHIHADSEVEVLDQPMLASAENTRGCVPSLSGMSLSEAMSTLENLGYKCQWNGMGTVKSTEPEAGKTLAEGSVVKINLGK